MWFYLFWILVITSGLPGFLGKIQWITSKEAETKWKRFEDKSSHGAVSELFRSSPSVDTNFFFLPEFLKTSKSGAQSPLFVPGMGLQSRPNSIKPLLFPTTTEPPPEPADEPFEALCHIDRIYVRLWTSLFHGLDPWRFLHLGNCEVNYGTADHFYFLYLLTADCGFTFEDNVDELIVRNIVRFFPTTRILRDLPFNISLACKYQKYFNSYKGAIRPRLLGHTLHKALRRRYRLILLIPQDASGHEKTTAFEMGETMYFEAKLAYGYPFSANERMYINKCVISDSVVPSESGPQIIVIDNYGCMQDAKASADSRFINGTQKITQRFSIKAGIFSEMAAIAPGRKNLFLHCDVSVKEDTASQNRKACNYDSVTTSWRELYGTPSVCDCCETSCPPLTTRAASGSKVISRPWKIKT